MSPQDYKTRGSDFKHNTIDSVGKVTTNNPNIKEDLRTFALIRTRNEPPSTTQLQRLSSFLGTKTYLCVVINTAGLPAWLSLLLSLLLSSSSSLLRWPSRTWPVRIQFSLDRINKYDGLRPVSHYGYVRARYRCTVAEDSLSNF